ncbi:MAG: ABC transporter [Rhodospirillaceae bacterium]|nr:ABC transporter [Rhodospirillaceae bacterium]
MAVNEPARPLLRYPETIGRATVRAVGEVGYGASLLGESLYWLFLGRSRRQPVRVGSVFAQMMEIGIRALPIVTILALTIGAMLAIQGIYTLRSFGAESRVVIGIAFSVTREFAPLIVGILVAGRSGSALSARLGTMVISQEVDALSVMGINPVRFLVVPSFVAMVVMVPALTLYADLVALFGGGLYTAAELGLSLAAYTDQTLAVLGVNDLMHGLGKSLVFAVLITIIGVVNGFWVAPGADGVGRATTRSVVLSIAAIIVTDMLFAFVVTK